MLARIGVNRIIEVRFIHDAGVIGPVWELTYNLEREIDPSVVTYAGYLETFASALMERFEQFTRQDHAPLVRSHCLDEFGIQSIQIFHHGAHLGRVNGDQ